MIVNVGRSMASYKILTAHYSNRYQLDNVRSPADYAVLEVSHEYQNYKFLHNKNMTSIFSLIWI